jgi:hypothetical protein
MENTKPMDMVLQDVGKLPARAVLLGEAEDGLPLMWDVSDSTANRMLVLGQDADQTLLIPRFLADYIMCHHKGNRVEFLVLTHRPSFWELGECDSPTACVGVLPFQYDLTTRMIYHIREWIQEGRVPRWPMVILIDGMENIREMSHQAQSNIGYILTHGQKNGIAFLGTTKHEKEFNFWMPYFQHEIIGTPVNNVFSIMEGKGTRREHLLNFYVPSVEKK